MKKNLFLAACVAAVSFIVGCTDKTIDPPVTPRVVVIPKPKVPTVKADTALHSEKSQITITTEAALVVVVGYIELVPVDGKVVYTTQALEAEKTFKIEVYNLDEKGKRSEPATVDVVVKVEGKEESDIIRVGSVKEYLARFCTAGLENSANPDWTPATPDPNTYTFLKGGKFASSGNLTQHGHWELSPDKKTIILGKKYPYNVAIINSNSVIRFSKTENGVYAEQHFKKI